MLDLLPDDLYTLSDTTQNDSLSNPEKGRYQSTEKNPHLHIDISPPIL